MTIYEDLSKKLVEQAQLEKQMEKQKKIAEDKIALLLSTLLKEFSDDLGINEEQITFSDLEFSKGHYHSIIFISIDYTIDDELKTKKFELEIKGEYLTKETIEFHSFINGEKSNTPTVYIYDVYSKIKLFNSFYEAMENQISK